MNEHPTHDGLASEPDPAELARIELASAYVDGDVDATQRAEVEASIQLMGIVASLQQVRAEVADLPPIDTATRQRALAAAVAEFDLAHAPPSNVVHISTHTRWSRVLTAAAAVLLIGVIGIAAVNGMQGTDSKSSSALPTDGLNPQPHADGASGTVAGGATTAAAGKSTTEATIGTIAAPASARVAVETPAQLLTISDQYALVDYGGGTAAATSTAPITTTPVTTTPVTKTPITTTPITTTPITTTPITTTGAPGGTDTAGSPGSPGSPVGPAVSTASRSDRPTLACSLNSHQEVIALITFKGIDAAAVLDTSTGAISAIDAQCHVLATAHR